MNPMKEKTRNARSEENLQIICAAIREGDSLQKVLKTPGMPTRTHFFEWMVADEKAAYAYGQARLQQGHWYADQIVELLNKPPERTAQGFIDSGEVNNRRLAIDALKWLAAKRTPTTSDGQVSALVSNTVNLTQINVLTEERRAEIIQKKQDSIARRMVIEQ
jgi:hypothetical protein